MTEIRFHTGVADVVDYACRLLRKAVRSGAQVAVLAPPEQMEPLDRALWTFEPLEFLPHARVSAARPAPSRLAPTPLWLLDDGAVSPTHQVLVNLGVPAVEGYERYERLIEVVSTEAAARAAARQRWKQYAARGYAIEHHEVAA